MIIAGAWISISKYETVINALCIMLMIGGWFILGLYTGVMSNTTLEKALIEDNKIEYVCDEYGKTKLVLIDTTMTNVAKYINIK